MTINIKDRIQKWENSSQEDDAEYSALLEAIPLSLKSPVARAVAEECVRKWSRSVSMDTVAYTGPLPPDPRDEPYDVVSVKAFDLYVELDRRLEDGELIFLFDITTSRFEYPCYQAFFVTPKLLKEYDCEYQKYTAMYEDKPMYLPPELFMGEFIDRYRESTDLIEVWSGEY